MGKICSFFFVNLTGNPANSTNVHRKPKTKDNQVYIFKIDAKQGSTKYFLSGIQRFSRKILSYEMRDCYYQKMRQKAGIKWNTLHKT